MRIQFACKIINLWTLVNSRRVALSFDLGLINEWNHSVVFFLISSFYQSLRRRILLVCLHIIVIVIVIPHSGWTALAAQGQPPVRTQPWPEVFVYATRILRNLSSAGASARRKLRDEENLIDCLVWITRMDVKSEQFDNQVSQKESRLWIYGILTWKLFGLFVLNIKLLTTKNFQDIKDHLFGTFLWDIFWIAGALIYSLKW